MANLTVFIPATNRQTWALKVCYGFDLRNVGLSMTEASELIDSFNKGNTELPKKYKDLYFESELKGKKKTYEVAKQVVKEAKATISKADQYAKAIADISPKDKPLTMFQYMTSNEVAQELIGVLGAEFMIGGVITNDIDKSDKKAYLFLGSGCGFSFIKFDGRNKKVAKFVEESNNIKRKVEAYYMTLIEPTYLEKLVKSGNPIQAHFMQNLSYNTSYNYKVIHYLESLGFKNITVTSHYD